MKKFDLNIDEILPDWELKHAVREVIANALDEQKLSSTQEIKIFKDTSGFWHIRDFGRGIRIENFTQKENSEKLISQKVIGKFGIGLKDAIATFDRNQVDIIIVSKYGEFAIGKSGKQDFEEIETLHVYPKQSIDPLMIGTDFIIKNISDRDIENAKRFFLKFSNVKILEETKYGEIIAKTTSIGFIYINDVLVAQEENFLFSYNITVLTDAIKKALNRERTNVGRTAYAYNIKQILLNCQTKDVQQQLVDDLKKFYAGTSHDELKWIDIQEYAVKLLNNPNSLYVTTDDLTNRIGLIDEAKESGTDIVVISTALHEKISGQSDFGGEKIRDLKQYASERNESFEYNFVSYDNLSSMEQKVYDKMLPLLRLIGGKPFRVKEILISETTQKEDGGFITATGVWDEPRIIIKRSQLSSSEAFLGTLLHEIAHAKSYASDVTRRFEQELTSMLGQLASLVVNNDKLPQQKESIVQNITAKEALDNSYLPTDGTRIAVKSSAIRTIGYNDQTSVLQIEFTNKGNIYEYYNVPKTIFIEFMNAESKNGFANRMIYYRYTSKNQMEFEGLTIKFTNCSTEIKVSDVMLDHVQEKLKKDFEAQNAKEGNGIQDKGAETPTGEETAIKCSGRVAAERKCHCQAETVREENHDEKTLGKQIDKEKSKQLTLLETELNQKSEQIKVLNKTKAQVSQLQREKNELKETYNEKYYNKSEIYLKISMDTEMPKVVYKFRDWNCTNHRNILYHNEIYLASPADFNDPFDCRIISDFSVLNTSDKKIGYLETLRQANPEFDIDQALKGLEEIIKNPENYERNHFEFDDKHLAIFCACLKWDIIPLWSHYANLHTGFCVGFVLEKILSAFQVSHMGELNYHDYPSIDPRDRSDPEKYIGTAFAQTHYKSDDWSYEKEFRLTRLFEKEMTLQDRLVHLSDDSIAEITIGLKFPPIDIPKVKEIATIKKWPLYQVRRVHMKFGLDRDLIN